MYYIEKIPLTDASFLAGSIGEPGPGETAWAAGTHAVGAEVIRPGLHRVFRCAVARTGANTDPPEVDTASWNDMRSTKRWIPLGPITRADGKLVHENRVLQRTDADIEYHLQMRYANAVAIFGMAGASWVVEVYPTTTSPSPVVIRTGTIKAPAYGYWDYAYGQRRLRDRVLVTDLPIYPAAKVVVKITGSGSQLRAVRQIEVGKLRFLPGVNWGGVQAGLRRSPRAYSYRKEESDGSSTTLLYGSTYDMAGQIKLDGKGEDDALVQLRGLLGKGVAFAPTLAQGFEQSLVFGTLETADTVRDSRPLTTIDFQIRGLPT
ncbi:hypothetical protein [Acidovorax sp. K2F]|uniref:hypothetical protein n=1 Tax=Acidovorax sp. K2F TaxID=2978125 RepID=UPI0021B0B6EC|nr:hypothetical protein [Acidovorax sp. K2F]MCT6721658.1 hypothetical protein [Acidovorax sp. K2F]